MLLKSITVLSVVFAVLRCLTIGLTAVPMAWHFVLNFCGYFVMLFLAAVVFLLVLCARVDLSEPQTEDNGFYRRVMYVYIEALMSLFLIRLHAEGLEKTPKEGRFLLVCNHQNESDPGVLLHCFKNSQLAFISKKENRTMPVVNKFMHMTLCQMIDRENDREALKTIIRCIQIIKNDQASVAAFPEGGILVEGKLSHFRNGMFKIAQKANVPIVVCTLKGTTDLFRNIKRLKPTHVEMHLLDVIPAEEIKGKTTVEIGEKVHAMMLADLGPEYMLEE